MSRIAAILTDWFEDSEYTEPAEAFRRAGHTVVTVGPEAGKTVTGKKAEPRWGLKKRLPGYQKGILTLC